MLKFKYLSKNKVNSLPRTSGVYAFKQGKNYLYIGKAVNIRQRVKNHFQHTSFKDDVFIIPNTDKIGYIKTGSEIEALLLEAGLIKKYEPKYNVVWKDDKNYFYIEITKEEFPRVFVTHQLSPHLLPPPKGRGESKRGVGTNYFGPFVDGKALKQTLKILRKVFPFRTCRTLPKKPCLYKELNLCPAPCELTPLIRKMCDRTNYVKAEKLKKECRKNVQNLMKVLRGQKTLVVKNLKKEMQIASQNQNFEKAATLRDQIFALENVFEHAHIIKELPQAELFWPATEKKLKALLGTKGRIKRIEGYDISNIQGKEATGSMVVFENGLPNKNEYRKFRIRIAGKPDDIAMLKEVLSRRFQHPEWPLPQVILIDGGKAQLNVARLTIKQFNNLTIKVIALAKRKNELFIEGRQKPILLKNLPREISNLVLQIRDEAHRFAISYHKKLRGKNFLSK